MSRTRHNVNVSMDDELHTKLFFISFAQKHGIGNKKASMSEIINTAIKEYIENHKEEIDDVIEEYNKRGVHIEI